MRMLTKILFISAWGFFAASNFAYAGMMSGKVTSVDVSTRKITLSTEDAVSGKASSVDIWAEASAGFSGFASLGDLRSGDNLWVEAEADSEGNLRASLITKA